MEKMADLVDSGGGGPTKVLSDISESLDFNLDEQKEKPNDLGMIDSDILELANQVGDEMDNSVDEANIASDLSFLENADEKETEEVQDDPGLAFLVADDKMEVNGDDLSFLEQQELDGSEYEEESEYNDSDDEESEDDNESEDEGEEGDEKMEEEEGEKKEGDKPDDDEGLFGQVSFYDEDPESKSSLDDIKVSKKKKSKSKKRKAAAVDNGNSKTPKKKRKLRKKKTKGANEGGEDVEEEDDGKPKAGIRRRNIRSILSEKDLDKDMLSAQHDELERQKRLMELKKAVLKENAAAVGASSSASTSSSTQATEVKMASVSTEASCSPKEKDSQLKSLLQVAEEEAEKEAESKERKQIDKDIIKKEVETRETSPPSDVITLSSDSDESDDDDGSDGVLVVPSDESDEYEDDNDEINDGGSHIDDNLNLPDPDGRVKINIGHPSDDPDIFLAPQIAQAIKPHQIGGVRFLYDNLVESLERFRSSPGFGCILAHSMGLGKTIQLISFIDIFIRCTGGKTVLCIVPINTLQNWLAEFNYWLPNKEKLFPDDDLTQFRVFPLYLINDSHKTTASRAAVVAQWKATGGVLIIGYEMFRLLSSKKVLPSKKAKSRAKKTSTAPEVIDVEEEDKNKILMNDMHSAMVDPGPDLVMCDEGHRIKNSSAAISLALKNIKTKRRVVLTGYPLQNNLMEYWCMVDFVRPSFLGTKTEFSNMFERPIMNGQCVDSTAQDKKVMRHRSYVLHNLLEGFVQRRGHTVLQINLPKKNEHVFLVRLSPIQRKIYCEFMNAISESGLCSWASNNPLKAFAVCCKIWNHPDVLHDVLTKRNLDKDNDLDIDTGDGVTNKKKGASKSRRQPLPPPQMPVMPGAPMSNYPLIAPAPPPPPPPMPGAPSLQPHHPSPLSASSSSVDPSATSITPSPSTTSLSSMTSETTSDKNPITYDWAEQVMKEYVSGVIENSGKMIIMKSIIEECLAVGDKVLVFSQSLLTLNKIEEFMSRYRVPRPELCENWCKNRTYFRLDGSTSALDREKLINQFNDPEGCVWLFLLSTKAGCLGINLVGANRVIVVDASWNPCHDCQAVCRVYRFGQVKCTYVYRLVTDNTLEKRIYDRQISKQGMSDRIIDDMNVENKFTRRQVENLLDFEDQDFPIQDFSNADTKYGQDSVLVRVLHNHGDWLTKQPFTHESLLIDRKELRLSRREKRLAKEGYARDKRMNVTYTRPSYAAYYPQQGGLPNRLPLNSRYNYAQFRRGPIVRPIASVRPIISASAQSGAEKIKQFGGQPLRPGVTIHQVITTTEIVLPGTNTGTQAGGTSNKIGAGQKILVIKTPKGVYIRTNDGKMFAVRSKTPGLGGLDSSASAASAVTTTTFSSAAGQVLISSGVNNANSLGGGKKPPIIIVSNKKGVPLSMTRGGSIIRTLPYGSADLLSSLRSNISLIKARSSTGSDSTSTTSSTSIKPITSVKKRSSLVDLINEDSDEEQGDQKDEGDEKKTSLIATATTSTSDGSTQATPQPKMPVIVLPSLAVRTPRPPSKQPSFPLSTAPGSSSTVVIMPTKPVVSMGTRRPPKNPKKKPNKTKEWSDMNSKPEEEEKKKVPFSLLNPSTSVVSSSVTSSFGDAGDMGRVTNSGSQVNGSVPTVDSSTGGLSLSQPPDTMRQHLTGGSITHNTSVPKTSGQQPPNNQPGTGGFPDLNSMWKANFGTGQSHQQQSMVPLQPGMMNNTGNPAPSSIPGGNPGASVSAGTGMFSVGGDNANTNMTMDQSAGRVLPPGGVGDNTSNNGQPIVASQNPMPSGNFTNLGFNNHPGFDGGNNNNNTNANVGGVNNSIGNNNNNASNINPNGPGGIANQFQQPTNMYNNGMGPMMQQGGPMAPPPYMSLPNFMQPFSNHSMAPSHMTPPTPHSNLQTSTGNPMMFGGPNQTPPTGGPPNTPYGLNDQQNTGNANTNPNTPQYSNTSLPPSNINTFSGQQGTNQSPFRFPSPANNYGAPPNQSQFMSQQQMGDQPSFSSSTSNPTNTASPFNTPSNLPPPQHSGFDVDQLTNNNPSSHRQFPPQQSQHNSSLPPPSQSQQQRPPSRPTSASRSSSTPTISIPTYPDSSPASQDAMKHDGSPYSLTLLGSESNTNTPPDVPIGKSKRSKSSSKSSKDKSSSSNTKEHKSSQPSGASLTIPHPTSSPLSRSSHPSTSSSMDKPILNNIPDFSGLGAGSIHPSHPLGSGTDLSQINSIGSGIGTSTSNSLNIPSLPNPLGNLPVFRPLGSMSETVSSVPSQFPSDSGLGGSAFRAHHGSSSSTFANPQAFRLDGAGGIGGIVATPPTLGYNAGMSAFSSPASAGVGSAYSSHNTFGAYGSGYANPAALPFSSTPMMSPQTMMGYPQPSLGYPSMSSLMMGGPTPATPAAMGGSMWPMMPPSMMGGAYGYPAPPPHPSGMGFSHGLDGQGFGS